MTSQQTSTSLKEFSSTQKNGFEVHYILVVKLSVKLDIIFLYQSIEPPQKLQQKIPKVPAKNGCLNRGLSI